MKQTNEQTNRQTKNNDRKEHRSANERKLERMGRGIMVCSNVPHYWVLGGYGWVHGAEITKQRQLLTNTKHDKSSKSNSVLYV